ncbi:hypothetical protein ACE5IS_03170, partial [Leptospira wolffii]|uniref:hypothetical protein n=1 Tax=Leptospira wolffii TaxID=409998 RepID=UPI0035CD3C31
LLFLSAFLLAGNCVYNDYKKAVDKTDDQALTQCLIFLSKDNVSNQDKYLICALSYMEAKAAD